MEIQKQYDAWSKAYMACDSGTLIGILSPDYKLIGLDKKTVEYDVYVAKLKLLKFATLDPMKYSTKIVKLTLHGTEADVVAVETMESPAKDPKSGKLAVMVHQHEYLDAWIRYDAGWRLRRTETRKESTNYRSAGKEAVTDAAPLGLLSIGHPVPGLTPLGYQISPLWGWMGRRGPWLTFLGLGLVDRRVELGLGHNLGLMPPRWGFSQLDIRSQGLRRWATSSRPFGAEA